MTNKKWWNDRKSNNSIIESYEEADIKYAQILSAKGKDKYNRTCNDCLSLHGLVVPVNKARDILPLHKECRCTWIVVIGKPILPEPDKEVVRSVVRNNPGISIAKIINDIT